MRRKIFRCWLWAFCLLPALVAPLFQANTAPGFYIEVLLGGLMSGVLYSLVALGFVLIFKASGVFNFAQGAMVLFAALSMARLAEWLPGWIGVPEGWGALSIAMLLTTVIMVVLAKLIERLVLRPLVNQDGVCS